MSRIRHRRGGDRGATMVEFAFVMPVLALLFAALTDLGLVVLGGSVASGGARDGARVGIIHFREADDTTSANYALVKAAVDKRLSGWIRPGTGTFVTVRCLDGNDLTQVKDCDDDIVVDLDVIEVSVSWEALSATGMLPIDRTQTDTARMVIVGEPADSGGGPVTPAATVGFNPTTYTTTEADGSPTSVTVTLTRSNAVGTASVNVATTAGSATAGSDFDPVATTVNFPDLQATATVTVPILSDDTAESIESFTVTLSNPIGVTLAPGGATATVTIDDDDGAAVDLTPPQLQGPQPLRMRDTNGNGYVDQVEARFNETLSGACSAAGAWTLAAAPSGGTLTSVVISGSIATLTIAEGAGPRDTAVGAFTLALSDAVAGICDPAGNRASFSARVADDYAGPVIVGVSASDGDGKAENGDQLNLTFSEPILDPVSATTAVSVTEGPVGTLGMPDVLSAPAGLGAPYAEKDLSFTGNLTRSGATLTVSLSGCSTNGQCDKRALTATSPTLTLSPAAAITDAAGRAATGSITLASFRPF